MYLKIQKTNKQQNTKHILYLRVFFTLDLPEEESCDHKQRSGTWRERECFPLAAGKLEESVFSPSGETSPPLEESESSSTP